MNSDEEILLRFLEGGGDEITSLAFNSLCLLGCFVHLVLLFVEIFTKVPHLRQCYYTGSEDKESFCLASVGKYES